MHARCRDCSVLREGAFARERSHLLSCESRQRPFSPVHRPACQLSSSAASGSKSRRPLELRQGTNLKFRSSNVNGASHHGPPMLGHPARHVRHYGSRKCAEQTSRYKRCKSQCHSPVCKMVSTERLPIQYLKCLTCRRHPVSDRGYESCDMSGVQGRGLDSCGLTTSACGGAPPTSSRM